MAWIKYPKKDMAVPFSYSPSSSAFRFPWFMRGGSRLVIIIFVFFTCTCPLAPTAPTLVGFLGHATLSLAVVVAHFFMVSCEWPKVFDLAKQRCKFFGGFLRSEKRIFPFLFSGCASFFSSAAFARNVALAVRSVCCHERSLVRTRYLALAVPQRLQERQPRCFNNARSPRNSL